MGDTEHKEASDGLLQTQPVFGPSHLAVYPYSVSVINLSHENNYMLSPLRPSAEFSDTM